MEALVARHASRSDEPARKPGDILGPAGSREAEPEGTSAGRLLRLDVLELRGDRVDRHP